MYYISDEDRGNSLRKVFIDEKILTGSSPPSAGLKVSMKTDQGVLHSG
jgi:hypothetical protein